MVSDGELVQLIVSTITQMVAESTNETAYRQPLVGFAAADDPLFGQLRQIIGEQALLPHDLLPSAQTVVSFFVPFTAQLVQRSRADAYVAREWAIAYIETNRLINDICTQLQSILAEHGVEAAAVPATHNFDQQTLTSRWSHKSVAYIAGLGTFGVHQMLITPQGTAGRCGSLVISASLPASARPEREYCSYRRDGSCLVCVANCPVQALSADSFDRRRCYQRVLEVDAFYSELDLCDVCGRCALGPCALRG